MNLVTNDKITATCINCQNTLFLFGTELFDTRYGINAVFHNSECSRCGLEQTVPVPSAEDLKSLYERYYNFGGESNTLYTRIREWFLTSWFYRFWMAVDGDISFHSKNGRGYLLDVGCNEGRGLAIYRQNGFTAEGLELNETAANVARQRGFTVYTELVENFIPTISYDVVVLSNVLEHSLNPRGMIADICRFLRPGGEIWISCPNNRSWLRSLFGRYWINWHVPFHVSHFSVKTLASLLQKEGLTVVEVKQYTPALWVTHSIVSSLFAKHSRPTKQLRNPLLIIMLISLIRGLCFPLLWFGNLLERGDCLVVTARLNK